MFRTSRARLPRRLWMTPEPWMMDDPGKESRSCTVTGGEEWGRGLRTQSSGNRQTHQPFELADFLAKARMRGPYSASSRMAAAR